MIGETILHYTILEKLGQADLLAEAIHPISEKRYDRRDNITL